MRMNFCVTWLKQWKTRTVCKIPVSATKQISLDRTPNLLCIQLSRYSESGKIKKHVAFGPKLDFSQFSVEMSSYRLVALVTHVGEFLNIGHTYIQRLQWQAPDISASMIIPLVRFAGSTERESVLFVLRARKENRINKLRLIDFYFLSLMFLYY